MSHFSTVLIVPKDTDPEDFISNLMAPFDENMRVDEYIQYDKTKAEEYRQEKIAEITDYIRTQGLIDTEENQELEEVKAMSSEDYFNKLAEDYDVDEAGNVVATYNPKSKWDWFRVGGRWDGWICDNKQISENGFNFDPKHETLENNSATMTYIIQNEKIPYAIVTPDGEWHEKGQMGWWGASYDEMEETKWKEYCINLYTKYNDGKYFAVVVDCHI